MPRNASGVAVGCRHSTVEIVLAVNRDRYEFRDAAGISQRVDNILGGQFSHEQCQIAFEGCFDWASIDALYKFCGASTANHFHHKFCILHSLLSCLEVLLSGIGTPGEEMATRGAKPVFNCG